MTFTQFSLDARLHRSIARTGYTTPTPIQAEAIPIALDGHDIVGTAQTGTGKTAAFVLPMLQRLLDGRGRRPRALVVTPTRELAEQIHDTVRTLAFDAGLRSAAIYGGVGMQGHITTLRKGVDILVACPGRLLDLMSQGHADLSDVHTLVLDEADRMFDMGFLPDVKRIIHHVPTERQTMLFSATFPPEVEALAGVAVRNPKRVAIGLVRPAHTISHALYPVASHLKTPLLLAMLQDRADDSVLVFTRTKHRAERVMKQLRREGVEATSLHSDRSQTQRQAALNGFKSGTYRVLVATDIAARGIDVVNLSQVINYDMPDTTDAYIHRIGRTGRAERTGTAATMVTPEDSSMVRTLERVLGTPLQRRQIDGFDYTAAAPPKEASQQSSQRSPRESRGSRQAHAPKHAQQARTPQPVRDAHSARDTHHSSDEHPSRTQHSPARQPASPAQRSTSSAQPKRTPHASAERKRNNGAPAGKRQDQSRPFWADAPRRPDGQPGDARRSGNTGEFTPSRNGTGREHGSRDHGADTPHAHRSDAHASKPFGARQHATKSGSGKPFGGKPSGGAPQGSASQGKPARKKDPRFSGGRSAGSKSRG